MGKGKICQIEKLFRNNSNMSTKKNCIYEFLFYKQ